MFPGLRAGEQLDAMKSPRLAHVPTYARLAFSRDLDSTKPLGVFLGIPFDGGTTYYSGARLGPTFIRIESRILRPYNMFLRVYPFRVLGAVDYGDVDVIPTSVERTLEAVEEEIKHLDSRGVTPFVAGGDHSVSLGILRGLSRHRPILLHLDSHLDYWDRYWDSEIYTHGTWVRRAVEEGLVNTVIQVGIRGPQFSEEDLEYPSRCPIPLKIYNMDHLASRGLEAVLEELSRIGGKLYVSIDIDVVDPAYAPGTGTREVGGFSSREIMGFIRSLARSGLEIVGFDVVEVSPPLDPSGITSLLAANMIYEAMSVKALQVMSRRG